MTPLAEQSAVMDFLLQIDIYDVLKKIKGDLALPADRAEEFFDLAMAFADGEVTIPEMPEVLQAAFELTPEQAKALAGRFVGQVLWPLRTFDSAIEQEYLALGGKPEEASSAKVLRPAIGAKEAATEALRAAGQEPTEFLVQRLGLLMLQYHRGEKTKETFVTFLGRPLNIGGMALAKENIEKLLAEVERLTAGQEIVSDAEFDERRAQYEADRTPVGELEPQAGEMSGEGTPRKVVAITPGAPGEADDISREVVQKTKESQALMTPYAAAYEQALQEMLAAMPEVVGAHKDAEQKLLDILGKGIRGVRDVYQTRDTLKTQLKLTDVEVQGVMTALAKGMETYAEHGGAGKPEEVPQVVADTLEEVEAAAFDRRFAMLTGKAPQQSAQPLMSAARVSAARTAQEEVATAFARVPEDTMRQAEAALRPAPAKVELTVGSVAPQSQHALTDVVPTNRLHGPLEQLSAMSATEFRRLHPTPEQAAAMVERLINDLQSTAIEERIKGIKAWRTSPMNALYAEIAAEALTTSKSVAEVATARRAKGAPSLSPAEMKALVDLNARLRF